MARLPLLLAAGLAALAHANAHAHADAAASPALLDLVNYPYLDICKNISAIISPSSKVYYPLSVQYYQDSEHWFQSSSEKSACVVEVGSADDTAAVIKLVGRTKTPFGIICQGHSSNAGFSSTKGVLIALTRFNKVQVAADKKTVTIGAGLGWADVYKTLEGTGVNVNGGRVSGPGVGGFALGGGYSWLTNQAGLTCDSIHSATLVLPNGTVTKVGPEPSDLLFALRGGLNRFGVVTEFVFATTPQPPVVHAGVRVYRGKDTPGILNATAYFAEHNTDPLAQVITTVGPVSFGQASSLVLFFYDGPGSPPEFAPFDAFKPLINTVKDTSFSQFVSGVPSDLQFNVRGAFHSVMTTGLTPKFLAAVLNETLTYSAVTGPSGQTADVTYDIEPFLKYGAHAKESAFPHATSPLPLNFYWDWKAAGDDAFWFQQMRASAAALVAVAKREGIYDAEAAIYSNYALAGTPAEQLYGANTARLRRIRAAVDPGRVMDLAGGYAL